MQRNVKGVLFPAGEILIEWREKQDIINYMV